MNERFKELTKQAGLEMCSCGCDMPTRQTVKFAELIVEDCLIEIQRCTLYNGNSEHNLALYEAMSKIKNKFGVEV